MDLDSFSYKAHRLLLDRLVSLFALMHLGHQARNVSTKSYFPHRMLNHLPDPPTAAKSHEPKKHPVRQILGRPKSLCGTP